MRLPVEASSAIMEFANRFFPNRFPPQKSKDADPVGTVSYTHLTLPTNREV